MPIAPRWFPKPQRLSEEAGLHRFVWDLRYGRTGENTAGEDDDEENERWQGPLVLPEMYKVKLSVAGRGQSQMLQVAMDPRSRATSADLALQFRWAQRVFEDMVSARKAAAELQAFQAQLQKSKAQVKQGQDELRDALSAAEAKSGELLTGGKQGTEHGLQTVSREMTVALNALESADRSPPSQVIAFYRDAAKTFRTQLSTWKAFKQETVPGLSRMLREAGLEPIEVGQLEEEGEESVAK